MNVSGTGIFCAFFGKKFVFEKKQFHISAFSCRGFDNLKIQKPLARLSAFL
jgi:hypothetical protein